LSNIDDVQIRCNHLQNSCTCSSELSCKHTPCTVREFWLGGNSIIGVFRGSIRNNSRFWELSVQNRPSNFHKSRHFFSYSWYGK
jgi:hypothetical protein